MKRLCACAAWIGMSLAGTVAADESGPYVSAALGRIDVPDRSELGPLTGDTTNNEWSWTVGAGYRFNPNIALELGYVDLGEIDAELGNLSGDRAHASFAAEGVTLALVGAFPIGRWEPYVKAGVLFSTTELQFVGTVQSIHFRGLLEQDTEDPLVSAGVRFAVAEPIQVFFDLTYLDDVGEPETGRSSYFNATAGVLWRF